MFSPRYTAHGNVWVRDLLFPAMVVVCGAACVSVGRPGGDSQACSAGELVVPALEWFDSSSQPARGSVLVSHGLNNRPEIMTDLIAELAADGLDVLRVALPPECGDRSRAAARIEEGWLEAIGRGFEELSSRPTELRYALGYSLGAVLTLAWLDACASCDLEAMALIAPPVELKWLAKRVRLLTPFRHWGMYVPSMAPKQYRQRSRVSLASYRALLNMTAATRTLARRDFFAEVPTVVFVSRQDEFVSYRGVVDWVGANRLDAWSVVPVEPSGDRSRFRDHLLVLPEYAGEGPWRGMVDQIRALFAPVPQWPVPQ